MAELIRIQKLLAQAGIASRRSVETMIEKGLVKINNNIAKLGDKATINDEIKINNKIINLDKPNFVYYLLNKPKKTISTAKDPLKRTTVVDLIDTDQRIVPVGRLDYNTTGVLLLTNDLELVNKLTHPKYQIKRTYRVRINEPLTLPEFKQINKGVIVNGKMSHQIVDQVDTKSYLVTLHVGSYHHVKELFKALNKEVLTLKRISYANLTSEKLPEGAYRPLTLKELKDLKLIIKNNEENLKIKNK
ncbi:pseudouridine synthase [Mycoplasmopsis felifaucium]|uniref:Pseudouridine synthase n=1 Tax=Mycoplasmopsis felifaucium TaxID=35768 RepID=A0ABZ2RSB2_9BACT